MRAKLGYVLFLFVFCALFVEIIVRGYFAVQIGPRTLLYGTDWHRNVDNTGEAYRRSKTFNDPEFKQELSKHMDSEAREDSVEKHSFEGVGYTKFFSNEKKTTRDVDTGERLPVYINKFGFRGPEFELIKSDAKIRVLTLGASSTFGFYNRDTETYPSLLQGILNENCDRSVEFEVINFGIPHATSHNIRALVEAEGFKLDPDVITFYQGRNDSGFHRRFRSEGVLSKIYSVLVHRLLTIAFIDQVLIGERESVTAGSTNLESRKKKVIQSYLDNLNAIWSSARDKDVLLIVANQQATSNAPYPRMAKERLLLKGLKYEEEVKQLETRFNRGESLGVFEYSFLVHSSMMEALEDWAISEGLPFIDFIQAINDDRHLLLSWVHLHPEANKILAEKLSSPILDVFCK